MRKLFFIIVLFFSTSSFSFDLFGFFSNKTELYCECNKRVVTSFDIEGSESSKGDCSDYLELTINKKNKTIESNFPQFKKNIYYYEESADRYFFSEGSDIGTKEGIKKFGISRSTGELIIESSGTIFFDDNTRMVIIATNTYNCDLKKNKKNKF